LYSAIKRSPLFFRVAINQTLCRAQVKMQKEHRLFFFVREVVSFSKVKQNIKAKDSPANLTTGMSVIS